MWTAATAQRRLKKASAGEAEEQLLAALHDRQHIIVADHFKAAATELAVAAPFRAASLADTLDALVRPPRYDASHAASLPPTRNTAALEPRGRPLDPLPTLSSVFSDVGLAFF